VEVDAFPRREDLEGLVADLSERFQRVSSQLGRAKESEVRELLRGLSGRTVEGKYFGQDDPVRIPTFNCVDPYCSADGRTELDALAEADDETWIAEVKWRLKRVGRGELAQLVERAEQFGARGWCISQAGFTPEAVDFAAEHDILLSKADDVKALNTLE
jgi:hypothetical protein